MCLCVGLGGGGAWMCVHPRKWGKYSMKTEETVTDKEDEPTKEGGNKGRGV